MFLHNPIVLPNQDKIVCVTNETGRTYAEDVDKPAYPSITTVLKDYSKVYIEKWKERVGAEKASYESNRATERGNGVHEICEKYIQNVPLQECLDLFPQYKSLFLAMKRKLDKHLNNVVMQETALFSHKLKVAGRVDCVGEWDGVPSVIDFKGSKNIKREDYIESYKIQATFYSLAFYEQTKIPIKQCVILMVSDGSAIQDTDPKYITDFGNVSKAYIFNPKEYYGKLVDEIGKYYTNHNNE